MLFSPRLDLDHGLAWLLNFSHVFSISYKYVLKKLDLRPKVFWTFVDKLSDHTNASKTLKS